MEHSLADVDADSTLGALGDPIEDQPGAAADFEYVLVSDKIPEEIDLEIINHGMIAAVTAALVPIGELIVILAIVFIHFVGAQ
jgi:hypothetical protein